MLRLLWVKTLANGRFSLACGCYHNLVLFEAYEKQTEMACFTDHIFYMPIAHLADTAAILNSIVSNIYHGILWGQMHIYCPLSIP